MNGSWEWSRMSLALIVVLVSLSAPYLWAQTLGMAPQFKVAVQGQTGAQPEGAFFNLINWIGNVVAPVGAGGNLGGQSEAKGVGFAEAPLSGYRNHKKSIVKRSVSRVTAALAHAPSHA
jgi:hypothetical protein